MKTSMLRSLALGLILPSLALLPAAGRAAEAAKPKPKAAAQATAPLKVSALGVKVLGDSTLHKWEAKAGSPSLNAAGSFKAGLMDGVKAGSLSSLELVVPVDSLKSAENSAKMDKKMHEAMESSKYPEVRFTMASYTLDGLNVTAKGSLSIHGQSKDVELKGVLAAKGESLTLKGSFDLKMSEYGIKPPVMMLGTIKVADLVTIAYEFELAK